jgi:hypothetical protein
MKIRGHSHINSAIGIHSRNDSKQVFSSKITSDALRSSNINSTKGLGGSALGFNMTQNT